jgi:hypothetical protein
VRPDASRGPSTSPLEVARETWLCEEKKTRLRFRLCGDCGGNGLETRPASWFNACGGARAASSFVEGCEDRFYGVPSFSAAAASISVRARAAATSVEAVAAPVCALRQARSVFGGRSRGALHPETPAQLQRLGRTRTVVVAGRLLTNARAGRDASDWGRLPRMKNDSRLTRPRRRHAAAQLRR